MLEYGLRSQHVSVLFNLYTYNALTSKELCEKCEEDKGTISRTLKFLEENDFISCTCVNKKRYNSQFLLKEKGEVVGKEIALKVNELLNEVNATLNENEKLDLYGYLTKISDRLDHVTNNLMKGE